jgi:hypothetical protein
MAVAVVALLGAQVTFVVVLVEGFLDMQKLALMVFHYLALAEKEIKVDQVLVHQTLLQVMLMHEAELDTTDLVVAEEALDKYPTLLVAGEATVEEMGRETMEHLPQLMGL